MNKQIYLFIFIFVMAFELLSAKTLVLSSPVGGDFQFPSSGGSVIDTQKLRGSNIILFFGFTNCKTVCSLVLSRLKLMYQKLSESEKKKTQIIFISVDNERDTANSIKDYLAKFNMNAIGGTDADVNLKKILNQYGARYYRERTKNNYILVDHTTDLFIINKKGIWADTMGIDSNADELARALQKSDQVNSFQNRFPESRTLNLIHAKSECNLTMLGCQFEFLNQSFQVMVSEFPVKAQREFSIRVKKLKSIATDQVLLTPQEVDFEGVEFSMGYLRPKFLMTQPNTFEAKVSLPSCELTKMNWKITLELKDTKNNYYAVQFKLASSD